MFKTILLLAVTLEMTFADPSTIPEEDDTASVVLGMDSLLYLSQYAKVYPETVKFCKQITMESVCLRSTGRAPIGRTTNRRGNDGPGECMWFELKSDPIVQALGNQCLSPQSVVNYMQNPPSEGRQSEITMEDNEDINTVKMSEGLFEEFAANAPAISAIEVDSDSVKHCEDVVNERVCLQSTSSAPNGRVTGRRGNDGPGECMWFQKRNSPVVQALGNQCLPPQAVFNFIKRGIAELNVMRDNVLTASNEQGLDYNLLGLAMIVMVFIGFGVYYKCGNDKEESSVIIEERRRPLRYQSV